MAHLDLPLQTGRGLVTPLSGACELSIAAPAAGAASGHQHGDARRIACSCPDPCFPSLPGGEMGWLCRECGQVQAGF